MFPSKRISTLEQQIKDLTAQLNTANTSVQSLTTEKDTLTQQLLGTGMVTAEAHKVVVDERDSLLQQVKDLQANAQTASQQAADITASVSVPPVAPEKPAAVVNPTTPDAIVAHYKTLAAGSEERFAFYQKHKAVIDHA